MITDRRAVESLLAFWSDSGVDTLYAEEAVNRVRDDSAPRPPRAVATTSTPSGPGTSSQAPVTAPIDLSQARALAAAATDIEALGAAIAAFDGCALKSAGARQSVFYRGATDAPLMVIGEAPGADEDAKGAPFVGRAGQLLDRMLSAAGLEGRVFITNTVFWRPPGNRTPTAQEQLACRPFLERAIALVRPKMLLLMGGAAAKSVLDIQEGILKIRGRWFEWRDADGGIEVPALPTLHPAFLLRQPAAKKMAWQDLLTLTERLNRAERPG